MDNTSAAARMNELRKEIESHGHCYYELNRPVVSDMQYDCLLRELLALEEEHPHLMYPNLRLAHLNAYEINWSADPNGLNCFECAKRITDGQNPVACSYGSGLAHFERVLGHLPVKGRQTRLLILFQDPREQLRFKVCHPLADPGNLEPVEHRYFCMSQVAWENLRLNELTGSSTPSWPTDATARHFLRRYLSPQVNQWSYDGIVAYFLWLLRSSQAYITNHAKCHFGKKRQTAEVFKQCEKAHLKREIELFKPTVLLSFTSRIWKLPDLDTCLGEPICQPPIILEALHPAARKSPVEKISRIWQSLISNGDELARDGYDVVDLAGTWLKHSITALSEKRGTVPRAHKTRPPVPLDSAGDWFFNTNGTYAKGAYRRILEQNVIAVYGYKNAAQKLARPGIGDRVFAYLNGHGLIAVGTVSDGEVFSSGSVFGKQNEREYHRRVSWSVKLAPRMAISASEIDQWGYTLPVRSTLCHMKNGSVADRISKELEKRE